MSELNKIKLDIFVIILSMLLMAIGVTIQITAIVIDKYYIGHLGSALVILGLFLRVVTYRKWPPTKYKNTNTY